MTTHAAGGGVVLRRSRGRGRLTLRAITWIGVAAVGALVTAIAARGRWDGAAILSIFLVLSIALALFGARQARPAGFSLTFVAASLLIGSGYLWNLYTAPGPFDKIAHAAATFAVALTFGNMIWNRPRAMSIAGAWRDGLSIACFGLAVGAAWEIIEWVFGFISNLDDTIVDLMMDAVGAATAGAVSVWWMLRRRGG